MPETSTQLEQKKDESKQPPQPLVDSQGMEVHVGDTVSLSGVVSKNDPGSDLTVLVNPNTDAEQEIKVQSSAVKKEISQRIGAAPVLRQRTIEVPNPLGGVSPVAEHSEEAQKFLKQLKPGQGLASNSSPQVQELQKADSNPQSPAAKPAKPQP